MERGRAGVWVRRVAVATAFVVLIVAAAVTWRVMDLIDSEVLAPGAWEEPASVEVLEVSDDRIVLEDANDASRNGVWGIVGPSGYGQVVRIISSSEGRVEREFVLLAGSISAGEIVTFDPSAYPVDPRTAHGLPFQEIRVPGELGVNPAWLTEGESDTWVVFVHGKGARGREQSLRVLPVLRRLGFPVLVITYRNDQAGGAGDGRRHTWGLDEWPDLESALDTAQLRGADDFVLFGFDMGASIVAAYLDRSQSAHIIRGVVFDSPILDLEALVDEMTADRGIPNILAAVGKAIARIRFGLEWGQLNHAARAGEFDPSLPILLLHGTADTLSPIGAADDFAEALPDAAYERFGGASHGALWNQDPMRYESALGRFLLDVIPEMLTQET